MIFKVKKYLNLTMLSQSFSTSSKLCRRPPPKEEFENNVFRRRKATAEPFDR